MKTKVKQYIREYELIKKGQHIVVGVSGGADSMCLLHILVMMREQYNLILTVAHIHHGIRVEADEDARVVQRVCSDWGIAYNEHRCNIQQIAQEKKCSEEEAGRNERYMFFEEVRIKYKADVIAVAHTMNDQAETMLMRLIRGSGITGLQGMMPRRDYIIRPLLVVTREEVEQYCKEHHIGYRNDITNGMDIYTRNRLRLQVLPLLQQNFNPNVIEAIVQTTMQLQETEQYLDIQTQKAYREVVQKQKDGYSICIETFLNYHKVIQSRIIRKAIENHIGTLKNIHYQNIDDVLQLFYKQSGKNIHIGQGTIAIREHNYIRLLNQKEDKSFCYDLHIGIQEIVECNKKVEISLFDISNNEQRHENAYTKNIDYDKIKGSLQIRNRRPGDRILLKNGSKKLKDFFIDEKIPKTSRNDVLLIADESNVIWIIGYRLSEAYYITQQTKRTLQIKVADLPMEN